MIRSLTAATLFCAAAFAQGFSYPPVLPDAKVETYKTVGDTKLDVWIFNPSAHRASDRAPAIVFFFGGGWRNGSPAQFATQCRRLAERGMVAITADYRVSSREPVKAAQCVEDAKSAIRWVRTNAARLGIDPNRIAAAGGSAGGHIAAATATVAGFEPAGDAVSSVPNALVLFNPVLVTAPVEGIESWPPANFPAFEGTNPVALSPYHHVKPGQPPTLVQHGQADTTVPYATAEAFCDKMRRSGNRCELVGYPGANHGFFNNRRPGGHYGATLDRAERFLESLGWISQAK